MNDELVKRYSLVEIALLIIFMLGLALSYLFVKARHRIILSNPIELAGSGLAVSLPTNPGWIVMETEWRYESDSSMVLVAQYQIRGILNTSLRWRYVICSPAETAREILQRRLRESGSEVSSINTLSGPVPVEYAVVYPEQSDEAALCLGVVSLDFGRHLELEIFTYQQFDPLYPESLLRALAGGIVYQPPQQLKAGKQMIKDFWEQFASNGKGLADKDEQAFLIKNSRNNPSGYAVYHYSAGGTNAETQLQISHQFYDHNRERRESTFLFDGDSKRFRWTTTILRPGMNQPRKYSIIRETNGDITVQTDTDGVKKFTCDGLLVPELLLDECAAFFLQHDVDSIIIDVMASQGYVVPTRFEKLNPQNASARSEQIAAVVKTDFLHSRNSFDEFYFNANGLFIGRFEQALSPRMWEMSSTERLKQIFGENFQPLSGGVVFFNLEP